MEEITTKGSLCSGTGALDAAVPGQLVWYAEKDETASRVMKREHPGAANFEDITTTDWNYRQHHVDLLTSGDPCQSMSAAGRQLASDDSRFLWPDVARIIDVLKPREIFLENVQNIVSVALVKGGERGGVLKLRLDNLRDMGYEVRWTVLGACAVGAPHHRHRWFLRARYVSRSRAQEAVRLVNHCGAPRTGGRRLLPTPNARDGGERGTPTREHALRRVADPERSVNLEDAVMAYLLPTPTARDGNSREEGSPEWWAHRIATRPDRATKGYPLGAHVLQLAGGWGRFAEAIALWEQITGRPAPDPTVPAPKGGRRLNPELSEWMMGYPAGYLTADAPRNEALKMAGNGVVTIQARAAWDMLDWA